jgi:hypothetical protein
MSSSSESHGTHDLNAPTKDTSDVERDMFPVAWLIDDVMLTNIEEAAKEYEAGEHLVIPLVRQSEAAALISSLVAESGALKSERANIIATKRVQLEALNLTIERCRRDASEAERLLAEARATIDLIREEAGKPNSPLGRSDSLAIERIRASLSIGGGND